MKQRRARARLISMQVFSSKTLKNVAFLLLKMLDQSPGNSLIFNFPREKLLLFNAGLTIILWFLQEKFTA